MSTFSNGVEIIIDSIPPKHKIEAGLSKLNYTKLLNPKKLEQDDSIPPRLGTNVDVSERHV